MKKITFALLSVLSTLSAQQSCLQGTPSNVTVSYRGPEGVGYDRGYTSLNGFLTPNWQRGFQPFFNARGHVFDNGRTAFNAGIGGRWNVFGNWALGTNLFYDFRDAKRLRAHQIGPGLEMLSPVVDFRLNGYIPVGSSKKTSDLAFNQFTGVGNGLTATRRFTAALPSIAGEVGVPLGPYLDPYLSVGPYYLFSQKGTDMSCGGAWGGLGRLSLQLFDWMTIGGELSYDKEFKTRGNGFAAFSFPLGPNNIRRHGSRWKRWYRSPGCNDAAILQRLMSQDVVRQEIIPVCDKKQDFSFTAECLFVLGGAPAGGDGSFANPFNDLNDALAVTPCQCIYVLGGTFTGPFIPTCPLLGAGCDQEIPTIEGVSISLPPFTPGSYPVLTSPGPGFNIIGSLFPPVSTDLTVRGFELRSSGSVVSESQIAWNGNGSNVVNISCNRLRNTGALGIIILNVGTAIVDENDAEFILSPFQAWNISPVNAFITNNIMTQVPGTVIGSLNFEILGGVGVISNNFVRLDAFAPTCVMDVRGYSTALIENNDIVAASASLVLDFFSTEPSSVATVRNNRIEAPSGAQAARSRNMFSGNDLVTYHNNVSGSTNRVNFSNDVPGLDMCVSLDGNITGTFDLAADPGAVLDINETLANVTANNTGTVSTTGTVNFGIGCIP